LEDDTTLAVLALLVVSKHELKEEMKEELLPPMKRARSRGSIRALV
jgi:hypothetical protein